MEQQLLKMIELCTDKLLNHHSMVVTAESCTGGLLASMLTRLPGSSQWFERGFVTYSNEAKITCLGVNEKTITSYGAVSEETAREMAAGALRNSQASIAISTSGIAGPEGAVPGKPVGTVCFGIATAKTTMTTSEHFSGMRNAIQQKAALYALELLMKTIK